MRTIKNAVSHLPDKEAKAIMRAWKAIGCMDLYDGCLHQYLQVIAQTIEQRNEQLTKHNKAHHQIRKLLKEMKE